MKKSIKHTYIHIETWLRYTNVIKNIYNTNLFPLSLFWDFKSCLYLQHRNCVFFWRPWYRIVVCCRLPGEPIELVIHPVHPKKHNNTDFNYFFFCEVLDLSILSKRIESVRSRNCPSLSAPTLVISGSSQGITWNLSISMSSVNILFI